MKQDVRGESSQKSPELYKSELKPKLSIHMRLVFYLLYTVYASLVFFFIPFGVFYNTALDYQTMAVTVSMAATFTATTEVRIIFFKETSKRKLQ